MSDPYFPGQTPGPGGHDTAPMTDQGTEVPPVAEPTPPKHRIPPWAVVAIAVVVVAVVGFGAWRATTPTDMTVHGTMTLGPLAFAAGTGTGTDGNLVKGDPCGATDGYTDIATGAEVDVVDASGKVLGTGKLGAGTGQDAMSCVFRFTVTGVPAGQSIYGVKVGNTARGVVHFTKDQLFGDGPHLTLGG